jgi:hypothetical protein
MYFPRSLFGTNGRIYLVVNPLETAVFQSPDLRHFQPRVPPTYDRRIISIIGNMIWNL